MICLLIHLSWGQFLRYKFKPQHIKMICGESAVVQSRPQCRVGQAAHWSAQTHPKQDKKSSQPIAPTGVIDKRIQ